MTEPYIDPPGDEATPTELTVLRAGDLARFLASGASPYAKLVGCRRQAGPPVTDTIIVEVEVERPQVRQHDIRRFERVAVSFNAADDDAPEVLSLRPGFPVVPHLNLRPAGHLPSLCLSELVWDAQKLRWTPAAFIEQLRTWLAQTAVGRLHAADQSLEPLVAGSSFHIVLPHDLFTAAGPMPDRLLVTRAGPENTARVLLARRPDPKGKDHGSPFVAVTLTCKPQEHGVIRHAPTNLYELHEMLSASGVGLLADLRRRLPAWTGKDVQATLILIVVFPSTRRAGSAVEATDVRAFLCDGTVATVGKSIGVWDSTQHGMGRLLGAAQPDAGTSAEVHVSVLVPLLNFSRSAGALLNGLGAADDRKVVAIGAGALGSQVTMNLSRAGFGKWTIIDGDHLLPHNLGRHALVGVVGYPKAEMLVREVALLLDGAEVPSTVIADVLRPGDKAEAVTAAMDASEVILDMSASVPVARHLARTVRSGARRVSAFLSPAGSDLVVLAEDAERSIPLDCLEMQYYRAVAAREDMTGHMDRLGDPVRYAQSCRDVTSTIPQELVALHAATASRAVRQAVAKPEASIRVWRADPETMSVRALTVPTARVYTMKFGEWTLYTDEELLRKIAELRHGKLPNETGGVLIGSYDLSRKIVYVVDTILSPPDSKEWPTLYIRGAEELPGKVEEVKTRTGQNLEYAGEWHSHPRGYSCDPSSDDRVVFAWLIRSMDVDGLPALMMIAGDGGAFQLFLGEMA